MKLFKKKDSVGRVTRRVEPNGKKVEMPAEYLELYKLFQDENEFAAILETDSVIQLRMMIDKFCDTEIGTTAVWWDSIDVVDHVRRYRTIIVSSETLDSLTLMDFSRGMEQWNILNHRPKVIFLINKTSDMTPFLIEKAKMFATTLKHLSKKKDNYTKGYNNNNRSYKY